jgi:hypothetical protein
MQAHFVAVDGDDAVTPAGEVARVAAVSAGKVEHPGIGRDERRKAFDQAETWVAGGCGGGDDWTREDCMSA